jgi:pyruvate/2-oxoglutarate dehydrogenase complex dihydrolipoamide acyltransferase (E2) component
MQATALDRIQAQAQPVRLPQGIGAATVTSWWVRPGQLVNAGDTLATVGAGNMRRGIVSPIAGKVRALTVREGATVQAGATLAYVQPEGPPEPPTARQTAPTPRKHPIPPIGSNRPHSAPQSAPVLLEPVRLEVEPPAPSKQAKRERVKHRGFYILPSQERAIKRVVADLSLDEEKPLPCNDSELVRAAIDLLTTLPAGALRATVEAYKAKERAAQVGRGWPRPGRAGKQ